MRALVLCNDTFHSSETARAGLKPLGRDGIKFEYTERIGRLNSWFKKSFPLVVLTKSNLISERDRKSWLNKESAILFQEYVRKGNGLLVIHSGVVGYQSVSPMHKTIGGKFLKHPDECKMIIKSAANHPINEGVLPFDIHDEQYFVSVEDDSRIILISHSEHGTHPAGWVRDEGNGRVCVLTPGHNVQVWRHPSFQKILLGAMLWVSKYKNI